MVRFLLKAYWNTQKYSIVKKPIPWQTFLIQYVLHLHELVSLFNIIILLQRINKYEILFH